MKHAPRLFGEKAETATQPTYRGQDTSAAMGYRDEPTKERRRNRNFPRTAADMSVTVGKIKELARHFRGEGDSSSRRLLRFICLAKNRLLKV
jgi:hypothetical protein